MIRFNLHRALSVVSVIGALWVGASPASAGTLSEICDPCGKPTYVHEVYTALPGERNVVSVANQVDVGQRPAVHVTAFRDEAGIVPAPEIGCETDPMDPLRVICTWSQPTGLYFGLGFPILRLGDGDDSGSLPAGTLDGGAGADTLTAVFQSEFIGGPGDDRLTGGSQDDRFTSAATADGADTMLGGSGRDEVSYELRTRRVTADLDGDAFDGSGVEGDRIGSDVEVLTGGRGPDQLSGNRLRNELFGGRGEDMLSGHGGPDKLVGGSAFDQLVGGPGEDAVMGGSGRDLFVLADKAIDVASCGSGPDVTVVDRLDFVGLDCERVLGRRTGGATFVYEDESRRPRVDGDRSGEHWAWLDLGCPVDSGRRCAGRISVAANGRKSGLRRFALERGHTGSVRVPLPRGLACSLTGAAGAVTLRLRTRDGLGRSRVVTRRVRVYPAPHC